MISNHILRRRAILTAIATSSSLPATTGLSGAQNRTKITASSPACGTLQLDYSGQGPDMAVTTDGPETTETTMESGEITVLSIANGEYTVEERPAGSAEQASAESDGSPVSVSPCGLRTSVECQDSESVALTIWNSTDTCIQFQWRGYKDGYQRMQRRRGLHSGMEQTHTLFFYKYDRYTFTAWQGSGPEDCQENELTTINGVQSPVSLEGPWETCSEFVDAFPES